MNISRVYPEYVFTRIGAGNRIVAMGLNKKGENHDTVLHY